ncbi:SDR family oxidoreductase [Pseudomonas sp. OIL-1]|uniref:SDR family oxidoreductase n=1 Tax=Pseudomonas sp. OIL-1 TaxID=2706126 RepID=UPI0013A7139A|nr:SDR family oxidoreductase [Pseudomonas sp. OIL-1]QIB51181.1 SDR family oxidoreductase [Pseudomonas sp. OIL-1]
MANIVITGANRGIGLALVKDYLAGGDRVYAFCRSPGSASDLATIAQASEGRLTVHQIDMADGPSVARAVHAAVSDEPVHVLLNVAGVLGGETGPLTSKTFTEDDFADWHTAFEVMTIGPFRLIQALLPNLLAAKGKAMTVSSQLAASTWPYGGMYAYGAAKAGVNRVMRSLAIDLRDQGVFVATIHPGYVQTDMGGPTADITPQESAAGIRSVVANLTLENSGDFFKWNGELHPW